MSSYDLIRNEECRLNVDPEVSEEQARVIPQVVDRLVAGCGLADSFEHVSPVPIPDKDEVVEVIEIARRILFPGYFSLDRISRTSLTYNLGQEVTTLFDKLSAQITWSVRHDCYRYEHICAHCIEQGREKALVFLQTLPEIRNALSLDVKAALAGDPAGKSYDQIIFSYPGLFAITVHRLAHELYKLDIPLIPRIMSEYAHSLTGIDIHPGARIGNSFFIDHGTGVVIGETTEIGDRVRIYQGVTLGALSLPRDAGERLKDVKRHPTIEDDVIIYSGATILGGDTVIGARAVIGGNVWLTESVPPDAKVIIKKPELIIISKN